MCILAKNDSKPNTAESHHYVSYLFFCFVKGIALSVVEKKDDTVLKCLIEIAENTPKYLRPQMENIFPFCLKVS